MAPTEGVNVTLLREVMDHILAHPELHNQAVWAKKTACGTAHCFAGWACELSGLEMNNREIEIFGETTYLKDGRTISEGATSTLNIDGGTASMLFYSGNSLAKLKEYVDEICEQGRIE